MKLAAVLSVLIFSLTAFAQTPATYEITTPLEKAQIEVLEEQLKEHTALIATIRFLAVPRPMDLYYSVSGVSQKVANHLRESSEQVYGAMPRQVLLDFGRVAYTCTAAATFKGGLEKKDLRSVGIINCEGPMLTSIAQAMDTKCFEAKDVKSRQDACGEFTAVVLPSALSFTDNFAN